MDDAGKVLLIAGLALVGVAAVFWLLWWWLWHEVGYWTILIVFPPLLLFAVAAEARSMGL